MAHQEQLGQIIILNGVPLSGKSSIAAVIQDTFDGLWMNLGVDRFMQMTPARFLPGMGLRPGGERPDLEPSIPILYRALYESIAAHSRSGLNVVVDVGHHDSYAAPLGILTECARCLSGLPVLLWQQEVHIPGLYDLEVDTSALSPAGCAEVIRRCLETGPAASTFQQIAALSPGWDRTDHCSSSI